MLSKISFSYFKLAALIALIQKIVKLLNAKLPDSEMVAIFIARIEPQLEKALQAIGSSTKQALTEKVSQADLRRDNSYRALRDLVKAGLLRQNDAYQEACKILWVVFEKNGLNLYSIAREKETAALDSLLHDLKEAKYEEAVKITEIAPWITELDTNNQAYVAVTQERSAVRSTDHTVNDQEAFRDLRTSLDLLGNILNALLAMNTPEGIAEVVAEVSQYISEANTAAKQSNATRKDKNEEA